MNKIFKLLVCTVICCTYYACGDDSSNNIDIPEVDIAEEIVGEWVYDHPETNVWQSMKFVAQGSYFCYSDDKEKWTETLRNINKGNYGVKGMVISAANGTTYLDMTISKINGYEFTARFHETTLDFKFSKVLMRSHLTFGQSVLPPYEDLVDAPILSYKSHDESIAIVDGSTGEITAVANNGRTYVDIVTKNGKAVVKVMVGKINDGDETEMSPIMEKKVIPPQPTLNLPKAILGQWIWDGDYWESIKFLENGKVYYSNIDLARDIFNENASGNYTIDATTNRLTLKVVPTAGPQMTVVMAMNTISKYSFTAKFYLSDGQTTGTFTYAKQIGAIKMKGHETILPEYDKYIESGTIIQKYKSHNTNIVEVNSETGEIKAKMGGLTYVDVITEEGTAVVEVNVKDDDYFIAYDYAQFIGGTKQDVINVFGDYYEDGKNSITYNYLNGSDTSVPNMVKDKNWKAVVFGFDAETQLVVSVGMQAKDNVWFTNEEMTKYLSQHYYIYLQGTTDIQKAFINAENFNDATVGILWNYDNNTLSFVKAHYQPQKSEVIDDYSVYLGKKQDEVIEMMGSRPFIMSTESLCFDVSSKYVDEVHFDFFLRVGSAKEVKDFVQQVTVYLTSDASEDVVKSFLESKFVYESGIANSFSNYKSIDGKIKLYFNVSWKTLNYSWADSSQN